MPNRSALKILLVEGRDGPAGSMLESRSDFEILRVDRLTAAVRASAEAHAAGCPCDLLLFDIAAPAAAIAPEDQGLDSFRLARALLPELPIVILCEDAEGETAEAMVSEGAQACLAREGLDARSLASSLRQSAIRVRAEARRFRMLFDAAPIGILLAAGRRTVMANPRAFAILGRAEAELAPLSVLDLFPAGARSILEKALDAAGSGGIPEADFVADLERRDGSKLGCRVYVKGALLNDAPAVALYLVPASEAAAGARHFHQAHKMEALGRLAGGVAHDFNNLLTAINGYSEHLLTLMDGAGPVANGLHAIRRAGDTAASLTRRLLTFSQAARTEEIPFLVDEAITGMGPALKRLLGGNVELRCATGAAAGMVRIEPGQFERIILNLCVNAKDAMPAGGTLTITTGTSGPMDAETFTHLAAGPGSHIVVNVEDTGTGMERETLERLFEPFYTTKRGGRGTGLGLATVYGIVSQAGGGLSVSSAPGQGSRFRIHLPAIGMGADAGAESSDAAEEKAGRGPGTAYPRPIQSGIPAFGDGNRASILVVEDDSSLREMLRTVLERSGYSVLEAVSVPDALDILEQRSEGVDLVVTDMMLRGESGHGLAEKMQSIRPGQRTLFISGHALETLADMGFKVPAGAFLEKPFSPSQLAEKVRTLLNAARRAS